MQEDSLMNRALLKQDAKDAMKAANPHPVLTTLVFWAIQLAAQIILGIVPVSAALLPTFLQPSAPACMKTVHF